MRGDGPGEGWWGADEEDGRDGGSRVEEEVGGSGRPGGWEGQEGEKRDRKGMLDKNRWLTVTEVCSNET